MGSFKATEVSEMEPTPIVRPVGIQDDLRTEVDLYLSDVVPRWKQALRGACRVLVLSPYLTSKTAEAILGMTPGEHCEVYTVFQAENFASGASSIDTLARLQEHGSNSITYRNWMRRSS